MMRLVCWVCLAWALAGSAKAQAPVFWVLYGQYQVGKTFLPSDTIKSKDDITPIILIAKINGLVVLREKGAWQASKLLAMLQEKAKTEAFPELYVGKINPKRDMYLPYGIEERCIPPPTVACLPISSEAIGIQNITFKWLSKKGGGYDIRLMNSFDEVLQEFTQKDTTFTLRLEQYEQENFFQISICQCAEGNKSGHCSLPLVYAVGLFEKPEREALKKEYEELKTSLQTFSPALQHLHLACWLKQKRCHTEAFLACQEAQKLMPKSKVLYFLLGEWLAHHAYHLYATSVYPRWRFML